jgi:hypothetical protein
MSIFHLKSKCCILISTFAEKCILSFFFLCIYFVRFLRILFRLNIKKNKLHNKNKYKKFYQSKTNINKAYLINWLFPHISHIITFESFDQLTKSH